MAESPDELTGERDLFVQMARDLPVQTFIFSFCLPLFALTQFVNGLFNQGNLLLIGLFGLASTAFSLALTRYQIAAYRRRRLVEE